MRCEDVRRALPLSSGVPEEQRAWVQAHVSRCAECERQVVAYEADAQALAVYRGQREEAPAVMAGFADALMVRIAEQPAPVEAPILKPEFGERLGFAGLVAAAAIILVAVALGMVLGNSTLGTQPVVADNEPRGVTPTAPVDAPAVVEAPPAASQPLAAPRRTRDRAPMPRLRRGIVPVGNGTQRPPLSNLLQRVFPNWSPNGLDRRVPPLHKDEREVRF